MYSTSITNYTTALAELLFSHKNPIFLTSMLWDFKLNHVTQRSSQWDDLTCTTWQRIASNIQHRNSQSQHSNDGVPVQLQKCNNFNSFNVFGFQTLITWHRVIPRQCNFHQTTRECPWIRWSAEFYMPRWKSLQETFQTNWNQESIIKSVYLVLGWWVWWSLY